MLQRIHRLLVANRGEIAIRVLRAANELGIRTVAIYSQEDRFALHRFKADEAYLVGEGKGADRGLSRHRRTSCASRARRASTRSIPATASCPRTRNSPQHCAAAGIIFIGPSPETMRVLGNKVAARNLAVAAGVPVMPATPPLPAGSDECARPGAAGRLSGDAQGQLGRRRPRHARHRERRAARPSCCRSRGARPRAAFGNDEVYLEKLVRRARHVEVQMLGDSHGNLVHLFERDCSVQRRNQKVVERAPAVFLSRRRARGSCARPR